MSEEKDTKKLYAPIDGQPDNKFPLKTTSKGNIKKLALICSQRVSSSDQDRAKWAEQAGIEPIDWIEIRKDEKTGKHEKYLSEEDKKQAVIVKSRKPVYQVKDVYTEYDIHAALAPVLFDGFTEKIVEVTYPNGKDGDPVVKIVNQELFDNLLEDVINEAFLEYAGKRNPTSRLLKEFLNQSGTDLNHLLKALGT